MINNDYFLVSLVDFALSALWAFFNYEVERRLVEKKVHTVTATIYSDFNSLLPYYRSIVPAMFCSEFYAHLHTLITPCHVIYLDWIETLC